MRVGVLSLGDNLADPRAPESGPPSPGARHRAIVAQGVWAEQLGFDSFWVGEHHFHDYIVSAPAVVLAALAAQTSRLRLGTGVALLPTLDPVRVAEDYATVDCLSDGRLELGVGRGILTDTYEVFGADPARSRDGFAENLDLLLRLWTEEDVDWSGAGRPPLRGVTVHPRPAQRPRPPVWVGAGSSPRSLDLAVERELPLLLPSVLAPAESFAPVANDFRERWASAGRAAAGLRIGAVSHVHVGDGVESARRFWRPYYASYLELVNRVWLQGRPLHRAPKVETDPDLLIEKVAICGSAEYAVERILGLRETLGLDLHLLLLDLGGLPQTALHETLQRFAEDVLPHVQSREGTETST